MLNDYDFRVMQLRYIKAAVDDIPEYRPDGMDVAAVDAVLTDAGTVRQTYIDRKTEFDLARADYRASVDEGHDTVIGVYAAIKSRYRKDPASLDSINNLPVDDRTAADTIKRMQQTSSLWGKLPNIGTPPAAFVAWQGMTKAAFDGIMNSITSKQADLPDADQAFQVAEGNLHEKLEEMADLVTASLQQGRAQFKTGTEREVLEAIPNEPAQQPPAQPEITVSEQTGPGAVHLEFQANHATSFDVFRKLVADPIFLKVVDDGIAISYDATGLTAGSKYLFKVVGRNSLGEGPESEVATILVE